MPRKDSETLPAISLAKRDDHSSQSTSTSPKKPKIEPLLSSPGLISRLNAFLPAISAANRDLESEIATGTIASRNIENIDVKDEAYIEMNLGLGLLRQLDPHNPSESESESEKDEEGKGEGEGKGDNILGKLLKRPACDTKPGIQEVEQGRATVTANPKPNDDVEVDPLENI